MQKEAWGWSAAFWSNKVPTPPDYEEQEESPKSYRRPRSFTPVQEERPN